MRLLCAIRWKNQVCNPCAIAFPKFGSGLKMVSEFRNSAWRLATGLIHLPCKAAGVWEGWGLCLATGLIHLPRKAAGV